MAKTPVSPFGWEYINDLSVISEDTDSVDFLLHRLERGQIYTWVGPLLLAVNPGNEILKDLYDESHKNQFSKDMDMVLRNAPPHVYAIANRARYRLVQGLGRTSQVIVISGESGTGKTFNSRQILDFLAGIDKNAAKLKFPDGVDSIAHEIGNVCPLIAAFSTASTERNPSSSRHGQLVQLQYKEGAIRGACVHSFLLERTRVTRNADNFEIFYQIMSGLSPEELSALGLSRRDNYVILGESHPPQPLKYHEAFASTAQAMETLGFTQTLKAEIFQILALLLHLGNIKFREASPENCALDTTDDHSQKAITNACRLSSLQEHELDELLTTTLICPRSTRRRHTMYRRVLRTTEACRHRLFSIIRCIYDRLFHSLVDRINEIISAKGDNHHWLGILDIFGFESFETNGIEQLCINYSTERLQLYFMENYLESGQRELEEEGLRVLPPPPTMTIYRNRLGVIEQSLFTTMNDACQTPIPSSPPTVSQQLLMRQSNARDFLAVQSQTFVITHYSCPVQYNIHDLLEKNNDKVPVELSTTFYQTDNSLLKAVTNVPEDIFNDNGRVAAKKCTTLSKLKSSMDSLMQELNKCDTHYVRCVRPRRSGDWEREDFREQLISSGIIDALPLAKCKFPIRLSYEEFSKRYYLPVISGDFKGQFEGALGDIVGSENIAELMHLGMKRIFMTEALFFELERYRKEYRCACARKIEDFWLKHRSRRNRGGERPGEVLVKPAIIVTRPSLNPFEEDDDDVFAEEKSSGEGSMSVCDTEVNNNVEKVGFIPQIALNDHIVDLMSPMATRVLKNSSGMQADSVEQQVNGDLGGSGGRAKDRYVAEWLENVSPPAGGVGGGGGGGEDGIESPRKDGKYVRFGRSEVAPGFNCLSKAAWSNDGSSVICIDGGTRLFYRDRVLSKRRLAEAPLRFHIKKTCLVNSHFLPRSELPRGLQDCL
ncbi:unconventional myosin-XIX [Diachasma alloeum]|uniref:unconventional myosin-XIX n=1 Tax=Diachasma alloeum TaxID=454923 RepID=UPI000738238D|nr:unconventional myosin-XIX [Diachasma alloeum]